MQSDNAETLVRVDAASAGDVAAAEAVEWFVNCLEYGRGVPGAVWVRPDSDLSRIAALLTDEA